MKVLNLSFKYSFILLHPVLAPACRPSAPSAGPSVQKTVEGNQVTVTWTEIPRGQRGGCITEYTVYLGSKEQQRSKSPFVFTETTLMVVGESQSHQYLSLSPFSLRAGVGEEARHQRPVSSRLHPVDDGFHGSRRRPCRSKGHFLHPA